jgi:Tfp pilus assembly protein PilN
VSPLWLKAGAAVAVVVLIFVGGYFVKGKIEEAEQADILRQQIKAQIERQDVFAAAAKRTEDELARIKAEKSKTNREWDKIRAEKPATHLLDDRRIRLLRDATAPMGEAPR